MTHRIERRTEDGVQRIDRGEKAKAIACKSPEELIALAKAEGVKLTDEQLDAISGGWDSCEPKESGKLTC